MGGMVPAIERGYPQKEIAESAYQFQRSVESKEQVIVGVNEFVSTVREGIGTLYIDESAGERQLATPRRHPPPARSIACERCHRPLAERREERIESDAAADRCGEGPCHRW